jgi:hypothetical protein
MTTRFLRFWSLPRIERNSLARALIMLPMASAGLRVLGFPRIWRFAQWLANSNFAGENSPEPPVKLRNVCIRSVETACRHLPSQPSCLPRALVLWVMLRRRGIHADLKIGVAKSVKDLNAHAWIESHGIVLNDTQDVGDRFSTFPGLSSAFGNVPRKSHP